MFQSEKELERTFQTEGAFYKLMTQGEIQVCRSLAEIRRKGTVQEEADALFVLLNPGKSLPVAGEDSIPLLFGEINRLPLVPSTPDNTLYQLMRLMQRMNWNAVQVINLSDLRTGKFEEFKEKLTFMQDQENDRHSIFSIWRCSELHDRLEEGDAVIVGWGTNPAIVPAAEKAFSILTEFAFVYGIPHRVRPLYYHPFPWIQEKCIKWLDDMEGQIQERAEMLKNSRENSFESI
jgi:hypothetical protein